MGFNSPLRASTYEASNAHSWSLASNVQKKDMLPNCRTCIPFRAQGGGKLCTSTLYRLWFLKVILKKWAKYRCSCQKNVDINWLLLFPFSHSFSLSERLVAVLAPYFTFNGTNHTMLITLTHESHIHNEFLFTISTHYPAKRWQELGV